MIRDSRHESFKPVPTRSQAVAHFPCDCFENLSNDFDAASSVALSDTSDQRRPIGKHRKNDLIMEADHLTLS
jgi:hypothetical protein